MFRDRVREHYRVRGYTLHEDAKVRGRSGTVYRCDLVAEGPLGSLVVSFGDAGGFEGPELQAVRRQAQDIGAGAVVAAPRLEDSVQQAAREHGIVLIDDSTLDEEDGPKTPADDPFKAHPWPDQQRRRSRSTDAPAGLWSQPRSSTPAQETQTLDTDGTPSEVPRDLGIPIIGADDPTPVAETVRQEPVESHRPFDWLPGRGGQRTPGGPVQDNTPPWRTAQKKDADTDKRFPWKWVLAPLLYGLATALILFLLVVLF